MQRVEKGKDKSADGKQLVTCMRKSFVFCAVDEMDVDSPNKEGKSPISIGEPTEVRHVAHITFDRYQGFLGVPSELEPDVNTKAPSASAEVFGVSTESMQCGYDKRGNSVPLILLMLQNRLYAKGGLREEGIFRLTAENSEEEYVRSQLNSGIVPEGIDVHCLSGLIKAWFRELPDGVLDRLTPEKLKQCKTENDYLQLLSLLPPTESALLDWGVNLMADVVEEEAYNKMNERNVATVFAPNMSQESDPMIALTHVVEVMNFLKIMISKVLMERGGGSTQNEASIERTTENVDKEEEDIEFKPKFDQNIFEDCERNRSETTIQETPPSLIAVRPSINYRKKKNTHVKKLNLDVNKLPKRFNDNKHADFD